MTQEEFYNKVKQEINNIKNEIELNAYIEEKDSIKNELNNIKAELDELKKKKKDKSTNFVENINNRNKMLEVDSIINKLEKKEDLNNDEELELERAKEDKEELENWIKDSIEENNNLSRNILELLNKQEANGKDLLEIEKIIKKFNDKNPVLIEPINPNKTLEEIETTEALYNTDEFNEEEYQELKNKYKEEQRLIESVILSLEDFLNQSKKYLEEKQNKTYERDYEIWNKTYEKALTLRTEHNFIDEDILDEQNEEELKIEPVDLQIEEVNPEEITIEPVEKEELTIEPVTEETSIDDIELPNVEEENTVIEEPTEEVEELEPIEEEKEETEVEEVPEETTVEEPVEELEEEEVQEPVEESTEETTEQDEETTEEVQEEVVEEPEEIEEENSELDKYEEAINEEEEIDEEEIRREKIKLNLTQDDIDLNKLLIDVESSKKLKESIKASEDDIFKVIEAVEGELILIDDGIAELKESKKNAIKTANENVLNKYESYTKEFEEIINDKHKRNELVKLSIGRIKDFDHIKYLTLDELYIVSNLKSQDYRKLITLLINLKQYNEGIKEIKKIRLIKEDDEDIKSK